MFPYKSLRLSATAPQNVSKLPIKDVSRSPGYPADGGQLPILACYISSLSTSTPFRISVHSWATAAKPSALMESRRSANQKIMYMVQVIVDEARVL
jgi:hypothetical protein